MQTDLKELCELQDAYIKWVHKYNGIEQTERSKQMMDKINNLKSKMKERESQHPSLSGAKEESKNDVPYWVIEMFNEKGIHYYNMMDGNWHDNIHNATKFNRYEDAAANYTGYTKEKCKTSITEHMDVSETKEESPEDRAYKAYAYLLSQDVMDDMSPEKQITIQEGLRIASGKYNPTRHQENDIKGTITYKNQIGDNHYEVTEKIESKEVKTELNKFPTESEIKDYFQGNTFDYIEGCVDGISWLKSKISNQGICFKVGYNVKCLCSWVLKTTTLSN